MVGPRPRLYLVKNDNFCELSTLKSFSIGPSEPHCDHSLSGLALISWHIIADFF